MSETLDDFHEWVVREALYFEKDAEEEVSGSPEYCSSYGRAWGLRHALCMLKVLEQEEKEEK